MVDLDEGLWVQRVHALFALRAHGDESGLAKNLQVLGHAGLAQVKVGHQVSGGPLAVT